MTDWKGSAARVLRQSLQPYTNGRFWALITYNKDESMLLSADLLMQQIISSIFIKLFTYHRWQKHLREGTLTFPRLARFQHTKYSLWVELPFLYNTGVSV